MRASLDNFLYFIKQIVTGRNGDDTPVSGGLLPGTSSTLLSTAQSADGGIKSDHYIPLSAVLNLTTGTALTLAETSMSVLQTTAGDTGVGHVSFVIPRDYDEASDHLSLRVLVQLANADAGITITGTPTIKPYGGAAVAGTAVSGVAPFTTGALALSTTEQVADITLSGNGLKRDGVIDIALAYVGTTTGVANIYGLEIQYDSCLVSYNETDLTENSTGTLPGFGNPLR